MPNCEIGGSGDELRAMIEKEERRMGVVREARCREGALYESGRAN